MVGWLPLRPVLVLAVVVLGNVDVEGETEGDKGESGSMEMFPPVVISPAWSEDSEVRGGVF